ncbi:nuclear transport factor 2 family protein [Ichthyenterobacterium magnum]|uniref:SnoaL-like protein n=1 Tax=Ichthyenterobacterium magnum TaxID=1230530 RepID=A0A420DFF1_9FLAO|nr:nuclear transport factor 2 family protein [Ichthyenterobacterium magnum]RKE90857.1 hypothetical protein BXY80_2700 [Ichthyenterobacterium magnum]
MKTLKHLILFGLATLLLASCQTKDKRYTQQSPEIETVKTLIANYNNKTYDVSIYADTSKTFYNATKGESMSPSETIAFHKKNDALYSNRGFTGDDPEYEMVITDDGETWVNCWLDWKGTLAGNNEDVSLPIHLTYRFVDGKIVREVGMWDSSQIILQLQAIEAEKNLQAIDETVSD